MNKENVYRLINKDVVDYRVRHNHSKFDGNSENEFNTAMVNGDIKTIPFSKNKLGQNRFLVVNTAVKGQPGDVVMWTDDDSYKHVGVLPKNLRPMNVFGKVESVVTKL